MATSYESTMPPERRRGQPCQRPYNDESLRLRDLHGRTGERKMMERMKNPTIWEMYKNINERLKKKLLCIPPYNYTPNQLVHMREISDESLYTQISNEIFSPCMRANRIEYRYKYCTIFNEFMTIIEYATFHAFAGDTICSYLSLVPVVEGIFIKWSQENKALSFIAETTKRNGGSQKTESVRNFITCLKEHVNKMDFYKDDRNTIADGISSHLFGVLLDYFYVRNMKYRENFSSVDIFNRNIALHEATNLNDITAGQLNLSRLYLLLDIIAELYLWDTQKMGKARIAEFNDKHSIDVALRKELYLGQVEKSVRNDDSLIVYNFLLKDNIDDNMKKKETEILKQRNEIFRNWADVAMKKSTS